MSHAFLTEKNFCNSLKPIRERILRAALIRRDKTQTNHLPPQEKNLVDFQRKYAAVFASLAFRFYEKRAEKVPLNTKSSKTCPTSSAFFSNLTQVPYAYEAIRTQEKPHKYLFDTLHIRENICAHIDILERQAGDKKYSMAVVMRKINVNISDAKLITRIAYKAWVASAEREIKNVYLISINPDFVGPFCTENLSAFFVLKDVTAAVRACMQMLTVQQVRQISETSTPSMQPDSCPMTSTQSVFHIPRLSAASMAALIEANITNVNHINMHSHFNWTPTQAEHIERCVAGKPFIDRSNLRAFLRNFRYPRYYLDFESVALDISPWKTKPFQQVPFQYSIHVKSSPRAKLEHHAYLHLDTSNDPMSDPREGLIRAIARVYKQHGSRGTILAHHASFEKNIIRNLERCAVGAKQKSLACSLGAIRNSLIDLEDVFKKYYSDPRFFGSTSLKKIQPVLVPNRSYADLQGNVSDGRKAGDVYGMWVVHPQEAFWVKAQRRALLEYCELDTRVMVDIVDYLEKLV